MLQCTFITHCSCAELNTAPIGFPCHERERRPVTDSRHEYSAAPAATRASRDLAGRSAGVRAGARQGRRASGRLRRVPPPRQSPPRRGLSRSTSYRRHQLGLRLLPAPLAAILSVPHPHPIRPRVSSRLAWRGRLAVAGRRPFNSLRPHACMHPRRVVGGWMPTPLISRTRSHYYCTVLLLVHTAQRVGPQHVMGNGVESGSSHASHDQSKRDEKRSRQMGHSYASSYYVLLYCMIMHGLGLGVQPVINES
jgi:hypothetical protein